MLEAYHLGKSLIREEPCDCLACVTAEVSHPPVFSHVQTVVDPQTGHVTHYGEWLHGRELARYYAARDQFLEACKRVELRRMPKVDASTGEAA